MASRLKMLDLTSSRAKEWTHYCVPPPLTLTSDSERSGESDDVILEWW